MFKNLSCYLYCLVFVSLIACTGNHAGSDEELYEKTVITDDKNKPKIKAGDKVTLYYCLKNGEKVIINSTAGEIDFSKGTITLNSLRVFSVTENDLYDTNYLTVVVPLENDNIPVVRNRILTIDDNDPKSVTLEMSIDR